MDWFKAIWNRLMECFATEGIIKRKLFDELRKPIKKQENQKILKKGLKLTIVFDEKKLLFF